MLFVTTSRKPGALTRKLSRWMGRFLGDCDNRGKSPLGDMVERARKKGYKRLLLVYEKNGNPAELVFYEGDWLEPSVAIDGIRWNETKGKRVPHAAFVQAMDEAGEKIAELFALEEPEGGAVKIKASADRISFEYEGESVGPVLKTRLVENGGTTVD
ncbi:hypothetical protein COX86_00285 [Candidatus Micrarchaeota archaeon CG_4_10_14_0_2_um_filter_60_11]|nr:MAG: hypothetical protein AUJ16_02625 [Candidatus Micrarchaeota archaeon CG1_02_60_51]PIN96293.1 MAG: hypothetical protein COU39_01780 [Candidatus Micrarchaeota archaeon CG10_big_fil_rev_8_21_14_0_10_60_32]PIO01969.1 MAG: hypothetical protein COT58_02485 [Candidatus Micrarchaeota archaeon CG09_land_8_20_14_0_10_60_16]PIY91705.1 MAG: hypothetical protein COY71_01745 [Candidatus Micrarchaeota archaeon CG_4_10_14_0_8_um_filter_60_7]PIZ91312.1 MAG: hypothetical protein COX86_00285 [Candidatus Mi